jgi:MinD-like ATPase involved in chromosome partitioning or flagellar assembly
VFGSTGRPVHHIPFDPHLAEGGAVDLRLCAEETVLAFEQLASRLANHFPDYGGPR